MYKHCIVGPLGIIVTTLTRFRFASFASFSVSETSSMFYYWSSLQILQNLHGVSSHA